MKQSSLSHVLSFIVTLSITFYFWRDAPTSTLLLMLGAVATGRLLFAIARGPGRPTPLQQAIQQAPIAAPRAAAASNFRASVPARGPSNWPPTC